MDLLGSWMTTVPGCPLLGQSLGVNNTSILTISSCDVSLIRPHRCNVPEWQSRSWSHAAVAACRSPTSTVATPSSSRRANSASVPTNQEVISKSHDTPIHRPCRDPHAARIPRITAGLSQANTCDLGLLSAIYVGKSVIPRKRWPAHERTIRGSINAGPPLEIPTWRWMPCTRTRSPHHPGTPGGVNWYVGQPWVHTWFALPAITTPRPSRRCEPCLRTSHGPTKGNERVAPARAPH